MSHPAYNIKSDLTSDEVYKMYRELNDDCARNNKLPICMQIFWGARVLPTKQGKYLVTDKGEVFVDKNSKKGKMILRKQKLNKLGCSQSL